MSKRFVRDDASVKESVLDLITNIDPVENYVLSNFQRSTANDEFHFTPRDTLRTPTLRAGVEGGDPTYDGNDPTRHMNVLHIVDVAFDVTDSEAATDRYGSPEDRIAYETDKALKDWGNAAEFALVRSTLVSGDGSANARQMDGLKACLSIDTSQSGVSLRENMLNDYLQAVWDRGGNVDLILAPMRHKRKISGFNGGGSKFYNQDDKRLVLPIEIYESDASGKPVKLVAHRYVQQAGDTNYDLMGVESEHFAIAYLREPKVRPLAKTGDSERRQVIGELTLECRSENAGFITRALL